MLLYHGSSKIVKSPKIMHSAFNKDFYFGFYCTSYKKQAIRWATRYGNGVVNKYEYTLNEKLSVLKFEKMTEEWLDFIVACRMGNPHNYDIVEGPMANDTIFNYVQEFVDKKISRVAFWELAKFSRPTHQISFNTEKSLTTLKFIDSVEVFDDK